MNQNETRTLWISVAAALFAVFLLYSYTQEKSAELTKKFGAKQRVVVASQDINEMQTIDETMLQIEERPVDFVQPGAVNDPNLLVGSVALAPIKKAEQILSNKVREPGPITGLSLQVAPGKRAITLPVDEVRGVAKLVKPGDRIDLVAAVDVGKGTNQRREVKTIMQDVVILATGLKVINELPRLFEQFGNEDVIRNTRGDTNFSTITVEASPKESQDLIYMLSTAPGALFMTLRHPSDRVKSRTPTSTVSSVLGRISKPQAKRNLRTPARIQPRPKPKKRVKKKSGPFVDL